MLNFNFEEHCCGCGACAAICPTGAIQMTADRSGFLYPGFRGDACVSCGLCEKVCPHLKVFPKKDAAEDAVPSYLYHSADSRVKRKSSSGGAFYELAKKTVEQGGTVCGCAWDADFNAVHTAAEELSGLTGMQGSKYVQSNMTACFRAVLNDLKKGKEVLFSGTPCQTAAIVRFIQSIGGEKLLARLITAAIICHGVPAPAAWQNYVKWLEEKAGSRLTGVNFRDKTREGYHNSHCRYEFASGETLEYFTYLGDRYIMAGLVYNLCLRGCCSRCDFKGFSASCDIILGDWYADCEREGREGTSCIVCCTPKGESIVRERLDGLRKIDTETVAANNGFLVRSVPQGANRDSFLQHLDSGVYDHVERWFPPKYRVKMLLLKLGLYDLAVRIKRMRGKRR